MAKMRAKMRVSEINKLANSEGETVQEKLSMNAVGPNSRYPDDGSDEDNTYARFSPMASFAITIANPALFGQFEVGQKYYVDFTEAPA